MCLLHLEARLLRGLKGQRGLPGNTEFSYNEIYPGLLLGSLPHNVEQVCKLIENKNVGGFVTLNCSWELPGKGKTITVEEVQKEGIEVCWLPTPDFGVVSYADMLTGANFVKRIVEDSDRACYVHCN
eukprot:gene29586-36867_t